VFNSGGIRDPNFVNLIPYQIGLDQRSYSTLKQVTVFWISDCHQLHNSRPGILILAMNLWVGKISEYQLKLGLKQPHH